MKKNNYYEEYLCQAKKNLLLHFQDFQYLGEDYSEIDSDLHKFYRKLEEKGLNKFLGEAYLWVHVLNLMGYEAFLERRISNPKIISLSCKDGCHYVYEKAFEVVDNKILFKVTPYDVDCWMNSEYFNANSKINPNKYKRLFHIYLLHAQCACTTYHEGDISFFNSIGTLKTVKYNFLNRMSGK